MRVMNYEVFDKGYEIKFIDGGWELSRYGKHIATFNSKESAKAGLATERRRQSHKAQARVISGMMR